MITCIDYDLEMFYLYILFKVFLFWCFLIIRQDVEKGILIGKRGDCIAFLSIRFERSVYKRT